MVPLREDGVMTRRRRRSLGTTECACTLCGNAPMTIVESSNVRSGLALLRPGWDPRLHRYAECATCGARHDLTEVSCRD